MNDLAVSGAGDDSVYRAHLSRLEKQLSILPDKPDETFETTLRCLWALAAGRSLTIGQLEGTVLPPLDAAGHERLERLIEQRLDGVPLAHLTGREEFMGLVFLVSPAALVPRRETELLGRAAVERARSHASPVVIDVCSGCGNLALALAHEVPGARVLGSDLSADAVELARSNASFVGRDDVEFRCGDLLAPFEDPEFSGHVDIIVCNPPYMSSSRVLAMPKEIRDHEPKTAFDGGPFGILLLRRLLAQAPLLLKPGGSLMIEVGLGQSASVARLLERAPEFADVESWEDASGQVRALAARRAAGSRMEWGT